MLSGAPSVVYGVLQSTPRAPIGEWGKGEGDTHIVNVGKLLQAGVLHMVNVCTLLQAGVLHMAE